MGCRSSPTTWRCTACWPSIRWRNRASCRSPWGKSAVLPAISRENCWPSTPIAPAATASGRCAVSATTRRSERTKWPRRFSHSMPTPISRFVSPSPLRRKTATTAAIDLLGQAAEILASPPGENSGLGRHGASGVELFSHVQLHTPFDLLVPMKNERSLRKQLRAIPSEQFTRRWAGFATMKLPYKMASYAAGPFFQFVQRTGRETDALPFRGFPFHDGSG